MTAHTKYTHNQDLLHSVIVAKSSLNVALQNMFIEPSTAKLVASCPMHNVSLMAYFVPILEKLVKLSYEKIDDFCKQKY